MADTGEINEKPADIVFCGFFAMCTRHGRSLSGESQSLYNKTNGG